MKAITEKFIPYNLALALKKAGFDEPCLAKYVHFTGVNNTGVNNNPELLIYKSEIFGENHLGKNSDDDINTTIGQDVTAPLYQDVIDWFREKHNIRIVDDCSEGWVGSVNYRFKVLRLASPDGGGIDDLTRNSIKGDSVFDTYYKALAYAIEFALC